MVESDALERIPLFKSLASEDRALLESIAQERSYAAGDVIFEEGGHPDFLRILLKGLVSFRQHQKSGGEDITLANVADAGDVFGIAAIVAEQDVYPHGAVCLEKSEVIEIDGADFMKLCDSQPRFGVHVLKHLTSVIAVRLSAAREQIRSRIRTGLISHG